MKYYKGEQTNPYEGKDQNKAMLWFYECIYKRMEKQENSLSMEISDYIQSGLGEFEQYDDVPLTLKALLFNRYAKGAQSLADAVEPFKKFYLKYYKMDNAPILKIPLA